MLHASYISHPLKFRRPAGTSRGILRQKACWFILLRDDEDNTGIGEVSFIPGLSVERPEGLEMCLGELCRGIRSGERHPKDPLPDMPGIQFALNSALTDLRQGGSRILYPSSFTEGKEGIVTNGLIWMGDPAYMLRQIDEKLEAGFRVLKMKVGALSFQDELEMIRRIRREFGPDDLEIRLDANGAWDEYEALEKLRRLSGFHVHSLEQPIAAGQIDAMARVCAGSPVDIALDEELIGIFEPSRMTELLDVAAPAYLILKPGLLGGPAVASKWIRLARERKIGWWVTSALESNIGLNAIAQWTATLGVSLPQGLGTGMLYRNNIPSPLEMEGEKLWFRPGRSWDLGKVMKGGLS